MDILNILITIIRIWIFLFIINNYSENKIKYGIRLVIYLKKGLIMNQCILVNNLRLKYIFTPMEYRQI